MWNPFQKFEWLQILLSTNQSLRYIFLSVISRQKLESGKSTWQQRTTEIRDKPLSKCFLLVLQARSKEWERSVFFIIINAYAFKLAFQTTKGSVLSRGQRGHIWTSQWMIWTLSISKLPYGQQRHHILCILSDMISNEIKNNSHAPVIRCITIRILG